MSEQGEDPLAARLRSLGPTGWQGIDFEDVAAEVGARREARIRRTRLAGGALAATAAVVFGASVLPQMGLGGAVSTSSGAQADSRQNLTGTGAAAPEAGGPPESDQRLVEFTSPGEVVGVGTVLEDARGLRLCLGGVRRSIPPQCDGIALAGWDWASAPGVERSGSVRYGSYAVFGRLVRGVLQVTRAPVAEAAYVGPRPAVVTGSQATGTSLVRPELVARVRELPGLLSISWGAGVGPHEVTVVYDDGALQRTLDTEFGPGVVVVVSALIPVLSG